MCGRYVVRTSIDEMRRLFAPVAAGRTPNLEPTWNAAPTQRLPVVRRNPETGERAISLLNWGLVPHWAKDARSAGRMINARSETAAAKPAFRAAFVKRRALVPMDLFYEWRVTEEGKQPYAIGLASGAPMALAGLWEGWRQPDGEWLRTFTILTTTANALLAPLHERMPVILDPEHWAAWLGEEEAPSQALQALLRPYPNDRLTVWPVSRRVNSVRNNDPELIEAVPLSEAPLRATSEPE